MQIAISIRIHCFFQTPELLFLFHQSFPTTITMYYLSSCFPPYLIYYLDTGHPQGDLGIGWDAVSPKLLIFCCSVIPQISNSNTHLSTYPHPIFWVCSSNGLAICWLRGNCPKTSSSLPHFEATLCLSAQTRKKMAEKWDILSCQGPGVEVELNN